MSEEAKEWPLYQAIHQVRALEIRDVVITSQNSTTPNDAVVLEFTDISHSPLSFPLSWFKEQNIKPGDYLVVDHGKFFCISKEQFQLDYLNIPEERIHPKSVTPPWDDLGELLDNVTDVTRLRNEIKRLFMMLEFIGDPEMLYQPNRARLEHVIEVIMARRGKTIRTDGTKLYLVPPENKSVE